MAPPGACSKGSAFRQLRERPIEFVHIRAENFIRAQCDGDIVGHVQGFLESDRNGLAPLAPQRRLVSKAVLQQPVSRRRQADCHVDGTVVFLASLELVGHGRSISLDIDFARIAGLREMFAHALVLLMQGSTDNPSPRRLFRQLKGRNLTEN